MASVNLNALTEVQNPASTDNLLLFNETSNVATRIDYDKLAEAILNKTRDEIGGVSPISAIAALNSSKRYYVIGSAPILTITLSNTTDGQNYVLTNTRGDSVQISIEGSTLTIVKYNVSHTGTYEVYKSGSIIYVGIKFGSVYGTQGWFVYGSDGFNYSLSRVASIPSEATAATVITSQVDALNSRLPHLNYINATSFQEATDLQPDTYLNVIDISGTTDAPVSSRNRWFGFQYLNATKKYGVQIAFTFGLAALYMRWRNNSDTWTEWTAIQ